MSNKNYGLEVEDVIGKLFYKLLNESEIMEASSQEKNYKFQTTLIKDLHSIADEMGKRFEECGVKIEDVKVLKSFREVHFKTKYHSEKEVRKSVELDSLAIRHKWFDGEIWWEADWHEYHNKYTSPKIEYGKHLRKLAGFVKENYRNTAYHYIFNKYEDSINIVLNTIKEDKALNGGDIAEDVLEKSQIIINRFEIALEDKKNDIKELNMLQDKVAQKSLIGRLDSELEFIEKFIEA